MGSTIRGGGAGAGAGDPGAAVGAGPVAGAAPGSEAGAGTASDDGGVAAGSVAAGPGASGGVTCSTGWGAGVSGSFADTRTGDGTHHRCQISAPPTTAATRTRSAKYREVGCVGARCLAGAGARRCTDPRSTRTSGDSGECSTARRRSPH